MHVTPSSAPLPPLHGLEPVIARDTRILILCSYPGKEALENREYYAGARNQFWMLMSGVADADLSGLPYEKRISALLLRGIGLWDVVSACQSDGSVKTVRKENRLDRFTFFRENSPHLRKICFNGQPAGEYAPLFEAAGYDTLVLPSSSPAYSRQPLEKKREAWKRIL